MAKKPSRSGGRVTPKGTRPVDAPTGRPGRPVAGDGRKAVARIDPHRGRQAFGPVAPTRAGHHRGQR